MGLIHPRDYEAWRSWERSQHPLRRAKGAVRRALRRESPAPLIMHASSSNPRVLAALDVPRGTSVEALLAPLDHLDGDVGILTRGSLPPALRKSGWTDVVVQSVTDLPRSVQHVLSAGSFEAVSLPVHGEALRRGVQFHVVQHGLVTPFAPPLPLGSHLFAWTDADGTFWSDKRDDVSVTAVGGQLIWRAAQRPTTPLDDHIQWLGQLHGAELPRRSFARAAETFCQQSGAWYRPHPAERDLLSRAQHAVWRRRGIRVVVDGTALSESRLPVASVFSTGLIEAAARGLPAWGYHPEPPAWLEDLWERCGIGKWGSSTTRSVPPTEEPARVIAAALTPLNLH